MTANTTHIKISMMFQGAEQDGGIDQKLVSSLNECPGQWLQNCID